jgi:hypothetical protein
VDGVNLFGGPHQGMGFSSVLHQGTWVRLFFEQEYGVELYDKPVVIGVIMGIHSVKESGAFTDPSGKYPLADKLGQPDMSGLSRGQGLDIKNNNIYPDSGEEPQTPSSYPNGHSMQSASGNILEFDDTPGNERVQIFHKSGTYIEIKSAGNLIEKIVNDKLNIIMGNLSKFIDGNILEKIKGNIDAEILGNVNKTIQGTNTINITGVATKNASGDDTEIIGGNKQITAGKIMLN